MIKAILLVLLSELFTMVGQVLYKRSANGLGSPALKTWSAYVKFIGDVLQLPGIWLGLFCMGLALIIWLVALSQYDLSLVFSVGSIQYILSLVGAKCFLHEKIDRGRVIGTCLVALGILVISFS
jgi:undecaprenyl phosphate-alpha-L-ara4N flippase subunit ArnE